MLQTQTQSRRSAAHPEDHPETIYRAYRPSTDRPTDRCKKWYRPYRLWNFEEVSELNPFCSRSVRSVPFFTTVCRTVCRWSVQSVDSIDGLWRASAENYKESSGFRMGTLSPAHRYRKSCFVFPLDLKIQSVIYLDIRSDSCFVPYENSLYTSAIYVWKMMRFDIIFMLKLGSSFCEKR